MRAHGCNLHSQGAVSTLIQWPGTHGAFSRSSGMNNAVLKREMRAFAGTPFVFVASPTGSGVSRSSKPSSPSPLKVSAVASSSKYQETAVYGVNGKVAKVRFIE